MPVEVIEGEKIKGTEDDKFLRLALERFQKLSEAEFHIREAALEDLKFVYNVDNGQWSDDVRTKRENEKRPCLTFNKLRKFVAQVANHEREQRLAGRVRPVDDKADPDTAKVLEGLIRQIENASKADEIYADAGEKAIAGGFGFWRIITKEKDDSFEQEIFIEKIENQFSVYLDPDKNYGFIRKGMSKREFENQYPDKYVVSFDSSGTGDVYELWYEPDKVFIAEYFYKETYDKTIAQCINPVTGVDEVIELTKEITPEFLSENGIEILKQKTKKAERVKWAKITGHEILEKGEWAGQYIPIIEVVGDEVNVEGKKYKRSLIRDGKDPQRAYNYWLTHITESVALIPKSPYIVTPQQIKGYEPQWNSANDKTYPYLLYNPIGNTKPTREPAPQLQSGAAHLLQIAESNIQDTIGMYEASFGERSNERSRVAIEARSSKSSFGTYHFPDNFRRAVTETARQIVDLIPNIYDTERMERILGEDGKDAVISLNKTVLDERTGQKITINDLTVGKYDVVFDVRLFATRRQEASDMIVETMRSAPNIAPLLIPFLFKWQDWPGADELQEMLDKNMPTAMGQKNSGTPGQPGQNNVLPPQGGTS